ncbi:MAG: TonB-dependent receptor [Thermodesulfobacteriota bacterium]
MKKRRWLAILLFSLFFGISLCNVSAQVLTGTLTGIIKDKDGNLLPGVTVTVSSPSLMGTRSYASSEAGSFRFPTLPPGTYAITAELSGFKTVKVSDIVVRVGMVVNVDIVMEVAPLEEEMIVTAAAPTVDVRQSKIAVTVDEAILQNAPIARDMHAVVNFLPGATYSQDTGWSGAGRMTSVHGSSVRDNVYAFDGTNMNDPVQMNPITNINYDVIEEVEAMLGGFPAEVGYAAGAYVNIVTRSGGNRFSGGLTFFTTNKHLVQYLWTDQDYSALGVSKPTADKNYNDFSLSVGGPILKDRLWFFTNGRYLRNDKDIMFLPWDLPYAHPAGYTHAPWPSWYHREMMGFVKMTAQVTSKLRLMGMVNYTDTYRPIDESPSPRTLLAATRKWDENVTTVTGHLNYVFNQNTLIDAKASYVRRYFLQPFQEEAYQGNVAVWNYGTIFSVGRTGYEESWNKKRYQIGASLTRYQDNLLGGSHELKAGMEVNRDRNDWYWWRKDPLYWLWYRGSPYYYGTTTAAHIPLYNLPPEAVGVGYSLIGAWICGPKEGDNPVIDIGNNWSGFVQDSFTLFKRLTLNIGFRLESARLDKIDMKKGEAGTDFVLWLGEQYIKPYTKVTYPTVFPDGLNPYLADQAPDWKSVIKWTNFSPRIGMSFDPFGDGKTALKAFFGRYVQYLQLRFALAVSAFDPGWSWRIYWFDTNSNKQLDKQDYYFVPAMYDFRKQSHDYVLKLMDPNIKAPYTDELTVGISRELLTNFSFGVNFYYKQKKNIWQRTYWDPETGYYWYHWNLPHSSDYWVPFTTIVPAVGQYPEQRVTIYLRKAKGPAAFYRGTNLPELETKYQGLEFVFNKRMSNGWQLAGSVVISKSYGNVPPDVEGSGGWTMVGITPNYYVNSYGRLPNDRPLVIKLMGSFELPYGIILSPYYYHYAGIPWGRTVNIMPPADWCVANNAIQEMWSVYIDSRDAYRYPATDEVDLRLEKVFTLKRFGKIGAFVDVLNLFGHKYISAGLNPIDRYSPSAPNVAEPSKITTSSSYKVITSVTGTRVVKFSLRYSF